MILAEFCALCRAVDCLTRQVNINSENNDILASAWRAARTIWRALVVRSRTKNNNCSFLSINVLLRSILVVSSSTINSSILNTIKLKLYRYNVTKRYCS